MARALDRRAFVGGIVGVAALAGARGARALDSSQEPKSGDDASLGRTPHTRFAVNIEAWWGSVPVLDRIRRAAELGFPAIELWEWRSKDVDAIAKLCRELGIEVAQFTAWGFDPGLNNPKNHDAFVRAIEEGCATAKKLGAKAMCVVAGNDQPGMSLEEMHANVIVGLKKVASIAEKNDVKLLLEPMNGRVDHPGHCLYGSAPALKICRAVGSTHVKILWDLYHMQISEGDLCGRMREGFDQLGYVQLADHPGRNEPGTGEIHYPRVLRELHELGYRGCVGLECWPTAGELVAARAVAAADRW